MLTVTRHGPGTNLMTNAKQSLLLERLATLVRWRRLILINTLVVAVAAVVVSLALPEWYRAASSVFPPQDDSLALGDGSTMAAVAANALGRSRAGFSLFSSPSDIYVAILESRTVRTEIIRRHDLVSRFGVSRLDDALDILAVRVKIRVGAEGVVSLSVIDRDPAKAAEIANDFIDLLDAKSRERRRSNAGAVRIFLERRVAETRDSLALAEDSFRRVQEETGILVPEDQARALVESAVQIELGRKMREVELGMLRAQVGPLDPDRARMTREIDLLERQLHDMDRGARTDSVSFRVPLSEFPERSIAYARALRDLKIQEAIFELLTEQYETYRIFEQRDTPILQVLDRAVAPEKRYRPIRSMICLIATALGFLLACLLALFLDHLDRMNREDPEQWRMLQSIVSALHPKRWFSSGHDPRAP